MIAFAPRTYFCFMNNNDSENFNNNNNNNNQATTAAKCKGYDRRQIIFPRLFQSIYKIKNYTKYK
jgi:hypothetical protein